MAITTYSFRKIIKIIAEFRRPKEPPRGAPYPYRKAKETQELIFSWLSWRAVSFVGAYARRWRRRRSCARKRPYSRIQRHTTLVYSVLLCYGQLTPVKTKYPLTSITWSYRWPNFRAHWELQSSNQNFLLSWVSLIGLWTTRPRSSAFSLG